MFAVGIVIYFVDLPGRTRHIHSGDHQSEAAPLESSISPRYIRHSSADLANIPLPAENYSFVRFHRAAERNMLLISLDSYFHQCFLATRLFIVIFYH